MYAYASEDYLWWEERLGATIDIGSAQASHPLGGGVGVKTAAGLMSAATMTQYAMVSSGSHVESQPSELRTLLPRNQ